MKKIYQKPNISMLYFEACNILSSSSGGGYIPGSLYTDEEKTKYNLGIKDYSKIKWE